MPRALRQALRAREGRPARRTSRRIELREPARRTSFRSERMRSKRRSPLPVASTRHTRLSASSGSRRISPASSSFGISRENIVGLRPAKLARSDSRIGPRRSAAIRTSTSVAVTSRRPRSAAGAATAVPRRCEAAPALARHGTSNSGPRPLEARSCGPFTVLPIYLPASKHYSRRVELDPVPPASRTGELVHLPVVPGDDALDEPVGPQSRIRTWPL